MVSVISSALHLHDRFIDGCGDLRMTNIFVVLIKNKNVKIRICGAMQLGAKMGVQIKDKIMQSL